MSTFFLILGILFLPLCISQRLRGCTLKSVFLKCTVSLLFIAVAVFARSSSALAPFLILGLVFALLGDIWLDLKDVYPENDTAFTNAGFLVFGISHILYIAGLLVQYGTGPYLIASFLLAAAAAAFVGCYLAKPLNLHYGDMKRVILVYGFLMFSTVFVSGAQLIATGGGPAIVLFFIGSVLFAISDLILNRTYFGVGKDRGVDIIGNYVFYYAAQFLIAFSLVFL